MTIRLTPSYQLTTEHPASSYGQPVLVHLATGIAYGCADIHSFDPKFSPITAADFVSHFSPNTDAAHEAFKMFVKDFPTEYPQLP
jgi:hypothetical protein